MTPKRREQIKKANKKWRQANWKKCLETQKRYRKQDPLCRFRDSLRDGKRMRAGGAPLQASLEEIMAAFTGRCEICRRDEGELGHRLHLDHCHKTGAFRGWLCRNCNMGLGLFRDSTTCLQLAVEYLARNRKV